MHAPYDDGRPKRPSRLATATTIERCAVCGQIADQERRVLRAPGMLRFFRVCCEVHAAEYRRAHEHMHKGNKGNAQCAREARKAG